ncbi:PAS/PAC sensor hybrid histidine kinase [Shimia gijangensis]|uniref:Sensory/regulatory protein RpfC n=1 Tax=Shimia gijangensis TaxID=1470563 RepID=A0A1M6RQ83_9RHOB|nr:ATP-binding protein [Shimia gijangensis]SHK34619.1 PAS/PAC sensor hybrid histidine kinase [Shimia gijangensis]
MDTNVSEIDRRLAAFDRRHDPVGRLSRYASGRVKHFASRQILTLSGAITLLVLVSPTVGALAIAIALLGEVVDCAYLRTVPARLRRSPEKLRQISTVTTISGIFQGMTIAFCVAMAWITAPGDSGMFFALAYATGASINAGIILPFHRGAALGRLGVYLLTVCGLFVGEVFRSQGLPIDYYYNLLGGLMMGYMVVIFISYVVAGQKREYGNSRDLLRKGRQLALTNRSLQDQEREARNLALVAKGAHDSVIMSKPSGEIIWTNEAFTRITGYSREEARGKLPGKLLNGPETDRETSEGIAHAIQEGRSHRTEILNYTKDGRKIWVETNLAPVFDHTGEMEIVIAIERDITESKAHEAELAKAKLAAEQGEKAKSRFLATMSHEIRTPMNGIMGMADLLSEEDLSHESRLYVDTIRESADSLLTIINDVLDFSKLDAGRMPIHPVDFALRDCIHGVLTLLRPQAATQQLYLELNEFGDLPEFVSGDDTRIRQILLNVISNAIKFTETGGITVNVKSTQQGSNNHLKIEVVDTGIGIAENRLDHVFDQFSQADAATTRRFGGTGLGLAIARLLARKMGGDITIQSQLTQGSTFLIQLIVAQAEGSTTSPVEPTCDIDLTAVSGLIILLAEDNRTNRLLIEKYLKDLPVELVMAHDGLQAVELARQYHPDIVLMDMAMPIMDGLEATRQIRKLGFTQPHILALTANAFASDRAACREAGMNGFLSKPIRKQILLNELAMVRTPAAQVTQKG